MTKRSAIERDEECIGRAARRVSRRWKRLGTWRAVGQELGVNHGNAVALVRHGRVPRSIELRERLGLPRVLPSERRTMNKYHAIKTEVDGFVFDSRAEARRYGELKVLEMAGEIRELSLQVKFSLDVEGEHVADYVADFVYLDAAGQKVVEDVKGMRTAVYRLKKKLMLAVHGIKIVEVE